MASGGKSRSSGSQSSKTTSFISPDQLPFLKQLWGESTNQILGGGLGQVDMDAQKSLMGGIVDNPFMNRIQQFADPNNPYNQKQIDLLGVNLRENLVNNLMPNIANQAIQSGGFGGGRQGVAQGLALQGTQNAFAQGTQGILNNSYNQAQQAALGGGALFSQNALGGMEALSGAQQQQFAPLLALAQILGNPAILQTSNSKGRNTARNDSFSVLGG